MHKHYQPDHDIIPLPYSQYLFPRHNQWLFLQHLGAGLVSKSHLLKYLLILCYFVHLKHDWHNTKCTMTPLHQSIASTIFNFVNYQDNISLQLPRLGKFPLGNCKLHIHSKVRSISDISTLSFSTTSQSSSKYNIPATP